MTATSLTEKTIGPETAEALTMSSATGKQLDALEKGKECLC